MSTIKERAEAYFKDEGIDPNVKPVRRKPPKARMKAPALEDTTTLPCTISFQAYLFYMYLEVDVPDKGKRFCGSAGGVGAGDIESAGVIYFADWDTLVKTSAFGVAFLAEDGGVIQVTWGTHGNATAAGIGDGGAACGGSGSWKNL
jgi:hypothetical protein